MEKFHFKMEPQYEYHTILHTMCTTCSFLLCLILLIMLILLFMGLLHIHFTFQ